MFESFFLNDYYFETNLGIGDFSFKPSFICKISYLETFSSFVTFTNVHTNFLSLSVIFPRCINIDNDD